MTDYPEHRPNVGVVVFHRDGRVWLGRRAGTDSWQFPQGGVDEGEDFEAAALRELEEETGIRSVKVLGRTEGWIVYDFPKEATGSKIAKGWRGQKQVWFAVQFRGQAQEVRLDHHLPVEFDAWRWGRLDEAPGLVIPFKRAAYDRVVKAFSHLAGKSMSNSILMIHGVGGTSSAFDRLAPAFRAKGWRVESPTLFADLRTASNPPASLPSLRLHDYVEAMAREVERLTQETGTPPVLLGHSMGGLIVQKLAERGLGRAAILLTPASPVDARSGSSLAQAVTFANVLFSGAPETKSHKIWRTGFSWGVLNRVPKARHPEIFAGTVYDSGGVYADIAYPDKDPHKVATIDESGIRIPVLTIGGGKDRATPIADVRRVAAKYASIGGDYLEYPDNAHWIVDEPGTQHVIDDIARWLENKGLTAGPAEPVHLLEAGPARAAPAKPTTRARAAPKAKAGAKAGAEGEGKPPAKPKAPAKARVKATPAAVEEPAAAPAPAPTMVPAVRSLRARFEPTTPPTTAPIRAPARWRPPGASQLVTPLA